MDATVRQCDREQALTLQTMRPTIFALSTGVLPSAIAIIRISGPAARDALARLSATPVLVSRKAVVRQLIDPATGCHLDTALVLWFPGPATATGEDLVELHLHGGRAVVAAVERSLAQLPGLLPAEPGAFTRRAFENNRLDLSQVEGLANLLAAQNERQRMAAFAMAEGGLRREVERWQIKVLDFAARTEALIDFADESDVGASDYLLLAEAASLAAELRNVLDNPPAERLHDGVRVAIAGPPNAGKSTLLNALVGRAAAITSPIAGTTRDVIEAPVSFGGIAVVFIDMAGLRLETDDSIEAIGISLAKTAIESCDLLLWLGEPEKAPQRDHVLRVGTKSDLRKPSALSDIDVSALTGDGMATLSSAIVEAAQKLLPAIGSLALSFSQQAHIDRCAEALDRGSKQEDDVLRAEDFRAALRAIDAITGAADTEAMLDSLFGRFCIGK
jgi:tRNA modification GTPase